MEFHVAPAVFWFLSLIMRFKKPASPPSSMRFDSGLDLANVSLETAEGQPVTLRIPLLPEGTFEHQSYGTLEWTAEKFGRMISNFEAQVTGYVPMLNFDHSACNPMADRAEAAGWFTGIEYEPGAGLFALVELTDIGLEAIQKKRYRYISSEVANTYARSTGATAVDVITGAALTNMPFHDTMPGLFSGRSVPTFDAQTFATLEGDLSFEEIRMKLCESVRAEVRMLPNKHRYIEEVFPSFFIYEEYDYSMNVESEAYFRRDYSVSAGVVTLGNEVEEVEEVWVTKTREAFRAARQVALQLGRGSASADTRVGPARGKSMSQAQPKKTFGQWMLEKLGLDEKSTPEQFQAALNSAPAPEAETGNPTPPASFSQQDFEALQAQVTTLNTRLTNAETGQQTAQQELLSERAAHAVDAYITAAKIKPANRAKALEFAIADPVRFKEVYDSIETPVIDLTQRGFRGGAQEQGGPKLSATGEMLKACAEIGGEFITAMETVSIQRPELYRAYISEQTGRVA